MSDVKNVTFGKPKIGGAIFVAPLGTQLPTDAKAELNAAFKALGYVSDDGLENENSAETDVLKAWGGDNVLAYQKSKPDKFKFTLIEAMNVDVLKTIYGDKNVSGTIESGLTVKANSMPLEDKCFVIEMILQGNVLKRVVLPVASVMEVGAITYKDDEAVGYETTVLAKPDMNGNTHIEYMIKGDEA